jgi:hypothetical protein
MEMNARMVNTAFAGVVFVTIASCGSANDGSGSGGGGAGGGASSGGGPGAGIILSGDGGAGRGGPFGGGSIVLPDGAMLESCTTIGATRVCCSHGTQTCTGNEFAAWGPCLDSTGALLTCGQTGGGCDSPIGCDASVDTGQPPPDGPPPSDGPPPPPPAACTDNSINNEPEILVGYEPAVGQTVGQTGQIKVWVNDENSPFIAPGEQVDNSTGAIITQGNRSATAQDGLLYEPALYFAPQSPTNGGTPYFPQWIKGAYNNNPPTRGTFTAGAPIDPIPPGTRMSLQYMGEFVWDVGALGLAPGSYTAVFSVHDGDHDRAIGCISIVITR